MRSKKLEAKLASMTYEEKVRFAAVLFAVHREVFGHTAPLQRALEAIEATAQNTSTGGSLRHARPGRQQLIWVRKSPPQT